MSLEEATPKRAVRQGCYIRMRDLVSTVSATPTINIALSELFYPYNF